MGRMLLPGLHIEFLPLYFCFHVLLKSYQIYRSVFKFNPRPHFMIFEVNKGLI